MKRTKWNLILSILTIALLLLTSACGTSGNTGGPTASSTSSSGAAASESATVQTTTAAVDSFGKYTPEVNIETVFPNYDPTQAKYPSGDSLENNVWTRAYEKDLGIKLKYRWTCTADKNVEKINLMIASGDLPDIFPVDRTQFEQLTAAGAIADLTDVYNTYAYPYMKQIMEMDSARALGACKKGGKIFGLPLYYSFTEWLNVIWIRSDWMQNLNLPDPKTADDLFKIAEAFTTQDPDKNGKADTYGISMNNTGIGLTYWNLFHSYGGNFWLKDASGKLVDGMTGSPEQIAATRAALLKLQEFYKKGVVSKEFGMMDAAKAVQDQVAGKCGINFGTIWDPYAWIQQKNDNPKIEWKPFPVMSIDDKPGYTSADPFSISFIYVVKKDAKNPEALVKMMNLYVKNLTDPQYSNNSVYGLSPDNQFFYYTYSPVSLFNPQQSYIDWQRIKEAFDTKDKNKLSDSEKIYFQQCEDYVNKGDNNQWVVDRTYGPTGSTSIIDYNVKNNLMLFNEFTAPPTQSMLNKKPVIDKLWLETFVKIVMGADISEFDKYVEKAKSLGFNDITKEVNDWYTAQSK